ncbi:MAG: hypothetical protein WAM28_03005 [Chlamydiales bacterium]
MIDLFWITLLVLICLYFRLSVRIKRCEQYIKESKAQSHEQMIGERPSPPPLPEIPFPSKAHLPKSQVAISVKPVSRSKKAKPFQIPALIRENWIGVFGSIALVIGAVFFGLTSEIMQHPQARIIVMILVSLLLFGISLRLKSSTQWTLLCGWLRSIAGTVILFAATGAGMIEGLQFIHSPFYIIGFLCIGIVINILLASITPSQTLASLHVILSIIAFCLAPQTPILLPLGTLVASISLMNAYRAKWDLHLLLIVSTFSFQDWYWSFKLNNELFPFMHDLAIGCSLAIGLIAGLIHYSKKYKSPKLEPLPLIAHIVNWGLLTWNIWLHAQSFKWTPLLLGNIAIVGFILARIAKRKEILWLYHTDTLFSQLAALLAIACLGAFSASPIDISLLILLETCLFSLIFQFQKESFLVRVGSFSQLGAAFVTLLFTFKKIALTPTSSHLTISLRMGIAVIICWSYYLYCRWKKSLFEDYRFILFGKSLSKNPILLATLLGNLFFVVMYVFGYNSLLIQSITLLTIVMISIWRQYKEDASSNATMITTLILVHTLNWIQLFNLCFQQNMTPAIFSNCNFLGLLCLEFLLIAGNLLEFKLWKKNLSPLLIYALGIQAGLLIYVFTKNIGLLIPGFAFLGFSFLTLEFARLGPQLLKCTAEIKLRVEEGIIQIGWVFLIVFLGQFFTVHLQVDPIWCGISLHWGTEALAVCIIFYWLIFSPKNSNYHPLTSLILNQLVELCLGFITLSILVEIPDIWRPLLWVIIAAVLFMGSLNFNWPKKLYVYSWIYFIASVSHIAFATSALKIPSLFLIERYHLLAYFAIALQGFYVYMVYKQQWKIKNALGSAELISALYRYLHFTVLLPVFLGIALLFAFNFEKAILTLLWVGLICFYLSIGLLIKSKRSIQIGMIALLFCSVRLIVFDLVQSNLSTRALVFIGVGGLMLGMSILYKKYKYRLTAHEKV